MGILAASWAHSFVTNTPFLTVLVLVPLVIACIVVVVPQRLAPRLAQLTSGVVALLVLVLPFAFRRTDASGYQFVEKHLWLPDFGASFSFGVDGVSLWLVVLTALVFPVVLCLVQPQSASKGFFSWMLLAEGSLLGAFLTTDLLLFFVFFEFVLVPSFFVILGWGGLGRRFAALKFFLYTFLGSVFLLVGILAAAVYSAQVRGASLSFDYAVLVATPWAETPRVWLMVAFAIAFAVKTPLLPVHTWVKSFYQSAPLALVIVSSAVMVKLGAYGFIRFGVQMFGGVGDTFATVMCTIGVVSIVVGALLAIGQRDIRLVIAYSSISHLGMIVFGTFAGQQLALGGAVLQMFAHGVIATGILFLASLLQARSGTLEMAELRGWQTKAPWLGGAFLLFVLALIGVPGLGGFVGEFLILLGSFVTYRWWTVMALLGLVFAVIYGLWMYQRVFQTSASDDADDALREDLTWREKLVVAPIAVLVVVIGVYPAPILDRIEPTVEQIARTNNFVWTKSLDVRGFQQFPLSNAEGWAELTPGGNS